MKLTLLPNAVYLFKPNNSTNNNQTQTKSNPESKTSLEKLNKYVGLKQFV